jgi:hypothetical protein
MAFAAAALAGGRNVSKTAWGMRVGLRRGFPGWQYPAEGRNFAH